MSSEPKRSEVTPATKGGSDAVSPGVDAWCRAFRRRYGNPKADEHALIQAAWNLAATKIQAMTTRRTPAFASREIMARRIFVTSLAKQFDQKLFDAMRSSKECRSGELALRIHAAIRARVKRDADAWKDPEQWDHVCDASDPPERRLAALGLLTAFIAEQELGWNDGAAPPPKAASAALLLHPAPPPAPAPVRALSTRAARFN
jgi:hypothetical protein